MESLMIKELKRKLTIRKEKYRKDLSYVGRIFDVKEDEYLRRYDSIGDEMISVGIELEILERKMSDLDLEFEKLKKENQHYWKPLVKTDELKKEKE